jgi:hypothetical protein
MRFQPPGPGVVPSGIGRPAELVGPASSNRKLPRFTSAKAGDALLKSGAERFETSSLVGDSSRPRDQGGRSFHARERFEAPMSRAPDMSESGTPPTSPPAGPPPSAASPGNGITISRNVVIALLVVVAIVAAGVAGALLFSGSDEASAATVDLEPIASSGDNPFMPSVGTDQPDVTPPPESSGAFPGNTEGLYGGSLHQSSCEPEKMIAFLDAHPDKAAAWASVLRIRTVDIRRYVGELTPVILRTDTAVTNHGFANGTATTIPAILQAGTAVLVDKYGIPRVKCYCGNPLTPPVVYTKPVYIGPRWTTFTPSGVTIIQQTTVIIDIFVLVDPKTGTTFNRPRGTTGAGDVITISDTFPEPTTPATTAPTVATVPTAPPAPPTVPPTQPAPQVTAQDAVNLFNQRRSQCAGVVFPFEQHVSEDYAATPAGQPGVFTVTVTGHTESGHTQVFTWVVDVLGNTLTPSNSLAQTGAQYCGALAG